MSQIDIKKKVTCAFGMKAPAVLVALTEAGGRLYSGRLVGIATGTKSGVTEYGEWTALIGQFQFTDRFGAATRAVQAFGPDIVILPAVAALNGGAQSINVAVDVYAVADAKSPVGWSYTCASAIEESETDPLALLLKSASAVAAPIALAAPVAPAKPAKKG